MTDTITNEKLNARVDNMGKWAKQMGDWSQSADAEIQALRAELKAMATTTAGVVFQPASGLPAQVEAMWRDYVSPLADVFALRQKLIDGKAALDELQAEAADLENQASLDANMMIDDKTKKPLYTNDAARKAAAAAMLANSQEYKTITQTIRAQRVANDKIQAEIDYNESLAKELYSRSRALTAALDYQTASLSLEEK
jgi:hypothetical protein